MMDEGILRIRIMFTQNANRPVGLSEYQLENQYFLLYYQMIKHAFGLSYCHQPNVTRRVSLFLDEMPRHETNVQQFKNYLASLSQVPSFVQAGVEIRAENITGVSSHNHVILQALDIVLGAMQFRLNDKHLEKPAGTRVRGKRTRAKERVYKHIYRRICAATKRPNFNIGVTTGIDDRPDNRWHHPYRHWVFVPANSERIRGAGKARNR